MPILLWSTNTWLKYRVQQQFRDDTHYVWCSPCFDSTAKAKYDLGSAMPPSSDPASIYRNLRQAIQRNDNHDAKVASQKTSLLGLAESWRNSGTITDEQRDEIVAMVGGSNLSDWRPLVFVVPHALVGARVKPVPREKRASQELEFIIEDLKSGEFEIIEP